MSAAGKPTWGTGDVATLLCYAKDPAGHGSDPAARRVIDPIFLDTPLYRCEALEPDLGYAVSIKLETANPVGSFKARGTEVVRTKQAQPPSNKTMPRAAAISALYKAAKVLLDGSSCKPETAASTPNYAGRSIRSNADSTSAKLRPPPKQPTSPLAASVHTTSA
jgi:hypothetical protein